MIKKNFHMHTTYCDGNNTVREMIDSAIEKGFAEIGFSGHSHTPFDESYCMSPEATEAYREEVMALKEEYKDKIDIRLGIEFDYFSDEDKDRWDYLIGSVHYVLAGGEYVPVDETPEITRDAIDRLFGGDPYAFCEAYFAQVGNVVGKTGCDIVGHFDLITKFNEYVEQDEEGKFVSAGTGKMFDETDPRYVAAYTAAVKRIMEDGKAAGKVPLFEINTGAMSRGYRATPYPSKAILETIRDAGGKVILSSDSHAEDTIDCAFEEAEAMAKDLGLTFGELF